MYKLVVVDREELAKGEREEGEEHGFTPDVAHKTALDHLTKKDPHYYSKIAQYGLEEEPMNEAIKSGPNYPYSDKSVTKGRYGRVKAQLKKKKNKGATVVGGSNLMPDT